MDSAIDVIVPGAVARYISARRTAPPSLRMALECGERRTHARGYTITVTLTPELAELMENFCIWLLSTPRNSSGATPVQLRAARGLSARIRIARTHPAAALKISAPTPAPTPTPSKTTVVERQVRELKPGDRIRLAGVWRTVTAIDRTERPIERVRCKGGLTARMNSVTLIEVAI